MKRLLILLLIFFYIRCHYQDIIINGMLLAHGSFECKPRYKVIKNFLRNYKRNFTLCDLGASEGYFSFKIANAFKNSTCVMIEGNYNAQSTEIIADRLEALYKENTNVKNVVFLKKYITCNELKVLSECEFFDVVLALNFVHHFGSNWKNAIESIVNLGQYIIIQTPSPLNENAGSKSMLNDIHSFIKNKDYQIIGRFPGTKEINQQDTMYLIKNNKNYIERLNWHTLAITPLELISTFDEKFIIAEGIKNKFNLNLQNYFELNQIELYKKL